jgi:hypothetical protein
MNSNAIAVRFQCSVIVGSDMKTPQSKKARVEAGLETDRELYVVNDFSTIPVSELHLMFGGIQEWLSTILKHKVMRKQIPPVYAIELGRLIKGDAQHVSKRILKRFDELRDQFARLNFFPAFYATYPVVGPHSAAMMAISRRDGQVHGFAHQSITQVDGKIRDQGYFGYKTWLEDGTVIETLSYTTLPAASEVVERVIVSSDDLDTVLKRHRERIRKKEVRSVMSHELYELADELNRREVQDWAKRGVIRRASSGEVARIRKHG